VLTCPWHGATFDLESGKNLSPPAPTGVKCYAVRVEGGEVQVELP
jgi:3-phenylpropionate/trans-cinnamate dioxygenase ferredoxin subunit